MRADVISPAASVRPLAGRVALVTGGVKGIGRGISVALAAAGASVVVTYRSDEAAADQLVTELHALGRQALAIRADTADSNECRHLFDESRAAFGPVTVLVNNVGTADFASLGDVSAEDYRRVFDTNVLGPLTALQQFAAQPEADGGAVVNITTATLTELPAGTSLYSASKAALAALTVVAAKELAPRGIRVNAVAPTATRTERTQQYAGTPAETTMIERIPLGRLGTPADVGDVVVFLASDAARFLTGDTLHVSGGQV